MSIQSDYLSLAYKEMVTQALHHHLLSLFTNMMHLMIYS